MLRSERAASATNLQPLQHGSAIDARLFDLSTVPAFDPEWWWWNLYLTSLPYRGWWETAGCMGLVLVYNALGLMSNNVSLHVYTWEVVLCTASSMYICPNSLLYIQGEAVQFSWSIMLRRSVVGDHVSLVSLRPIPFLLIDTHITK